MNLRLIAARIIDDVTNGRSLSDSLDNYFKTLTQPRDRSFVQAICYGVCRFYSRLDVLLSFLLKKPMQAKDSDVHALLLVGLYQLSYMRVPSHAAVSETVAATEKLKKPWARGFVNAVLREYLRRGSSLEKELNEDDEAHFAHPEWWIREIKKAWPKQWQAILAANNIHPPFALRINERVTTRKAYLENLQTAHIETNIISETSTGIILVSPQPVEEIPGFLNGVVSVQDGAAQLAANLLELAPQQSVLDACAAPGGKLVHILEKEPLLARVVAIEKDLGRMHSIEENLLRANVKALCLCDNAAHVAGWWDGQPFDRILLDAPCSASGVIRRHPDIKLLRQPKDISALAKEQLHLLTSLWPTLKPGGLLLYVTCSIFPQENADVICAFLKMHKDVKEEIIQAEWGIELEHGRQILPGMHNMDGFYYAKLRKVI